MHGHFSLKKDFLKIPCLGKSSFSFELLPKYAENTDSYINFQASLLYTSSDGIRLIRIMNYQVPVEERIKKVLKSVQCDVLINIIMKQAVRLILKKSIILSGQRYLESISIDITSSCLIVFNKLPKNLEDFLLKILGLMKHAIFVHNTLPCKCN